MNLAVVVPCFNEAAALPYFLKEMAEVESSLPVDVDYFFVDDGSTDDTLNILKEAATKNSHLQYLSLSRNFGKEAALYAGLSATNHDYIAVMDADLQDPPALLKEMLRLVQEEHYDMVGTKRQDRRGEPWLRSFFSRSFYFLMKKISNTPLEPGVRDYRLMTRQVVEAVLSVSEYNRFSKGIFSWVGFKTIYLPYENHERIAGETSWSFWQLFSYSLEAIVNFSDVPLTLASLVGVVACLAAIISTIVIVVRTLMFGDPTSGWPSLATIILFVGGLQLFSLGIVGKYIGKIFLETKNRPRYLLKETNLKKEHEHEHVSR
ncbi:glycosyltransferase family 2 protein [Enterococcus timonensis]|uniref:glycosyltransferase family 2 protein n=1 Tax=Enterococcus timonensis TaxID=1852364 RepID=UPI0008D9C78D|nr:glycosyltransferase family 2 protein [Enterococcus timonensis]